MRLKALALVLLAATGVSGAQRKAPPPDDTRPSMTSWDQFKRWRGEKK